MTFFAADDRPIRRDSREKKTRSGRLFLAPQEEAYKSATGSAFYPYALYAVFLGNKTEGNICIRPFAFKREKGAGLRTRTDQKRIGRDRKVPKASRRGLRRKFRRRSSGKGLFVRRKKEKYVFIRNALSYREGERVQPPFAPRKRWNCTFATVIRAFSSPIIFSTGTPRWTKGCLSQKPWKDSARVLKK